MARIAGVDLPNPKRVEIGLTAIYGIGVSKSNEILKSVGVDPNTRVKDLTDDEVRRLSDYITEHVMVEGDLRRERTLVRGQKTKTNARTCKGPRKTVANKKKATATT